jgi:hypothetical protein
VEELSVKQARLSSRLLLLRAPLLLASRAPLVQS